MTATDPETDADALRSAYDALNRSDLSRVFGLIAPDIDWHDQATTAGGPSRGRESFLQYLHSWLESFDEFRIDPEEVFEHGDRLIAVVCQTGRGRISGAEIAVRIAHVWTIEDDRAIRWRSYPNREQAIAAHHKAANPPA
jgi:ketosteroid isomerase-like protein